MNNIQTRFYTGQAVALKDIPEVTMVEFREAILGPAGEDTRLAAFFGIPFKEDKIKLIAVTAYSRTGDLSVVSVVVGDKYKSITPDYPGAHIFEREIAEQWAVVPEGHPWLKPIRFHRSYRPGRDAWNRGSQDAILPCVTDFYRIEGEEIHEVAVGPVHAGVIEPGHFRFQCHGENVFHMEISLGCQHRGVERALLGGPDIRTLHYMETSAGDTSIGHATAGCQVIEGMAGCLVPERAEVIRGIALELERMANHTGDLGALAGDIGYLPTLSFCGRLRGDFLNMSALVCGSRFGRGLVRPGGVAYDIEQARASELSECLDKTMKDLTVAVNLLWDTPSVMARFEETGVVTQALAEQLGLVGVVARASGLKRDARFEFPSGSFKVSQIPVSTWHTGDVFARAWVRWQEIQQSAIFVHAQLQGLPDGNIKVDTAGLRPDCLVVSMVEGWRGEICHVGLSDDKGRLTHYKIIDPSFHNWTGLAMSLRDQQIADFPLCNKSFNLSYCGHDL